MALRMVNDRKIYDAPECVYCENTGEFIWFPNVEHTTVSIHRRHNNNKKKETHHRIE